MKIIVINNNWLWIILSLKTGWSIWILIIGRISESENDNALSVFGGWGLYSGGLNSKFYGILQLLGDLWQALTIILEGFDNFL